MTRSATALDPMPSPDTLRRLYRERTGREIDTLTGRLKAKAATLPTAVRLPGPPPPRPVTVTAGDASAPLLTATRDGNTLHLLLRVAPRTKKNHKRHYASQSAAYAAFRQVVVDALLPFRDKLALPLPSVPYNACAHYYVDSRGRLADKPGLDQGLYDALQDAGVILDDWWIRTGDGTRIIATEPRDPRIDVWLTPIPPEESAP